MLLAVFLARREEARVTWQWDGCPNDSRPKASPRCSASPESRAGIRCCGGQDDTCVSVCFSHCWMQGQRTSAPLAGWSILGAAATLAEAQAECQARGLRLCNRTELQLCCKTGCRLDNARVWTADECKPAPVSVPAVEAPPDDVACNRHLLRLHNSSVGASTAPPPPAPCSKRWCGVGPRAQSLLAAAQPLRCGVLWFVHIGKTGGSTVADSLKAASGPARWDFVNFWGKNAVPHWNRSTGFRRINQVLAQPGPRLVVHHHHGVPGPLEPAIGTWLFRLRARLQAQGCALVVSTVLREPVSRAISHVTYDRATPPQLCMHARDAADTQWRTFLGTWGCPQGVSGCTTGFHHGDDPAPSTLQRLKLLKTALGGDSRGNKEDIGRVVEVHEPRREPWLIAGAFDVVGATHELPRFLALLLILMGFSGKSPPAVTNPTPGCDSFKPSLEQLWWLHEQNKADAALYSAWCSESCASPMHTSLAGWQELPTGSNK